MMPKKFFSRAPLVCGASFVVLACMLSGCGKSGPETGPAPKPPEPSATHATDPKLKAQLKGQIAERDVLERARQTIVARMEDLVTKKYKGDMKAAANDPEMVQLIRRARDIETNFASNRAHTAEMIRARAQKDAAAQKKISLKKEVKQ